jgi:ATP-binding cassette, subfamily C, type I secretion system permease/ATPase
MTMTMSMFMPPYRLQVMPSPQTPLQAALLACAGSLGLVFAYSCSYNLLLFAPAIYLLQIYDRVLSSRSADTLLMLTLMVALAVVVGGVLDALRRAVLGRLGAWLEDRLRPTVLSTSLEYAFRVGPARAADVYRDLTSLRQFLESGSCPILFDVLWAPLFVGVLFLVHPLLGAIAVCSALFLFGLSFAGEIVTRGPVARSGAASTRSLSRLATVTNSVQVIKAMGMLGGAARLIYQAAQEARSEHDTAQRRAEIIMLIAKPVRALTQVMIMGCAAWLVLEHSRNPAIIFAASLLFGRAIAPVEGAISSWKAFAAALAAYRRLSEVLCASNPEKCNDIPLDRPEGRLTVNNVGVALPGSANYLLKGISFTLAPGDCLGIIGPSGCGKSILGQILAGISAPTVGCVKIDNIDVSVFRDSQGGRHLGYLPQDINLVGESIKEIIARLDDADPQKVIEAAKRVGLHEAITRLPQAYDTVIANAECGLSRGYRQRLGLARALFGDPRLVVLDEPNASLDYAGEHVLFEAIEEMKAANITVVIITHRMGILAATNKIAIMQEGAITAFGDSDEIFERYLSRPHITSRETAGKNQDAAAQPIPPPSRVCGILRDGSAP